jgi:hypothetical protein
MSLNSNHVVLSTLPRSGRPLITSDRNDRALQRLVRWMPFATSPVLKQHWLPNRRLSTRTVRNRLRSAGLKCYQWSAGSWQVFHIVGLCVFSHQSADYSIVEAHQTSSSFEGHPCCMHADYLPSLCFWYSDRFKYTFWKFDECALLKIYTKRKVKHPLIY